MALRMLEIKSNFKNRFKEIKTNKKDKKMVKTTNNNKTISTCKVNLKAKCMINKKNNKDNRTKNKVNQCRINKWVK
jgi:hypothetical protein